MSLSVCTLVRTEACYSREAAAEAQTPPRQSSESSIHLTAVISEESAVSPPPPPHLFVQPSSLSSSTCVVTNDALQRIQRYENTLERGGVVQRFVGISRGRKVEFSRYRLRSFGDNGQAPGRARAHLDRRVRRRGPTTLTRHEASLNVPRAPVEDERQ